METKPVITLKSMIQSEYTQQRFHDVLGKKATTFIASLLAVTVNNDSFAHVDAQTVLSAAMTAATLDLPINPNLGFAYVIPYKGQAQFQMGYKGFVQLAMRSGQFKTINVSDVREGEIEKIDHLTGEITFAWKEDREKLSIIGYVAYMRLINGFEKSLYMTKSDLLGHGTKYSQTMKQGFGLWKTDFDAMAKKTVIKLLLSKYAPLTTDMQKAQLADQAVIDGEDNYNYPDNTPLLPEGIAAEKEKARILKHIEESKTLAELQKCEEFIIDDETRALYEAKKGELSK